MKPDTAKRVMKHATNIAQHAAELCRQDDNSINNQETITSLMLATAIMARFFDEKPELLHHLLDVMCMAAENVPVGEHDEQPLH